MDHAFILGSIDLTVANSTKDMEWGRCCFLEKSISAGSLSFQLD
jgi:hypothetical protein